MINSDNKSVKGIELPETTKKETITQDTENPSIYNFENKSKEDVKQSKSSLLDDDGGLGDGFLEQINKNKIIEGFDNKIKKQSNDLQETANELKNTYSLLQSKKAAIKEFFNQDKEEIKQIPVRIKSDYQHHTSNTMTSVYDRIRNLTGSIDAMLRADQKIQSMNANDLKVDDLKSVLKKYEEANKDLKKVSEFCKDFYELSIHDVNINNVKEKNITGTLDIFTARKGNTRGNIMSSYNSHHGDFKESLNKLEKTINQLEQTIKDRVKTEKPVEKQTIKEEVKTEKPVEDKSFTGKLKKFFSFKNKSNNFVENLEKQRLESKNNQVGKF